jgi:hypothetical protein
MRYLAECLFNSEQTRSSGSLSATAKSPETRIQLRASPFFVTRACGCLKNKASRPPIRIQPFHLLPELESTPMTFCRLDRGRISAHNFNRAISAAAFHMRSQSRLSIVNNQPRDAP